MSGVSYCYNIGLDPALVTPPSKHFLASSVLTRSITCRASRQTSFLLRKGCDPNMVISQEDGDGGSGGRGLRPLMVACFVKNKHKRLAVMRTLLEHGADPSLPDAHGRSSVAYACALSLRDEVECMVKDCDYNLNTADRCGDTPLHMCAKAGDPETLEVVLGEMMRYGTHLSIQNNSYLTPLSLAILNGHADCATLLHEAGAFPRFSLANFTYVISVLCKRHHTLSNTGVKAIADARSVGRAFNAKNYCLIYSPGAVLKRDFAPASCRKNGNAAFSQTDFSKAGLTNTDILYMCACRLPERYEFKLPPIHDVCRQPRPLSYY